MNIAVASDHAGFQLKSAVISHLSDLGYGIIDRGTYSEDSVDYPDFIRRAVEKVALGECGRGIVMGGTGNGEAMTANRRKGIRCALCWNRETARLAAAHNNSNMIALGAWLLQPQEAFDIVDVWLKTDFEGGRHVRRIAKMDQ